MPIVEIKLPKMGESISEATIINWLKNPGDYVEAEEVLVEVATDKVDNEVPSPVSGILKEIRFSKNDIVGVGDVMALIDDNSDGNGKSKEEREKNEEERDPSKDGNDERNIETGTKREPVYNNRESIRVQTSHAGTNKDIFLSPLIISIAQKENLSIEELQTIAGTGTDGRIRKSDVFNYLKNRKYPLRSERAQSKPQTSYPKPQISYNEGKDRIVEMDRMRKMIAGHMVYSKQTSPHVTSYLEVDVTNLVEWRNKTKDEFASKHGQKLTFTPVFVQAVAKAISDFPMINVSVDGDNIIVHGDINVGMATALPTGNLIVPVVKNADQKNIMELASEVNHLAESARINKLSPDDVKGSTFTISNVGTFGSLMGTPIINQPEAAILAFGLIKKRPEVITTENGDEIAIRSMMFLSLSFDHRIVDGFLGGSFLRKVGDYLEQFDTQQPI